jgi:hypothetical protein
MSKVIDEKYYRVVPNGSLAKRVLNRARDRIYDDFLTTVRPKPTDKILEVGISDVVSDDANVVERKYPYPERITACGLGDAVEFKGELPEDSLRQNSSKPATSFRRRCFRSGDVECSSRTCRQPGKPIAICQ